MNEPVSFTAPDGTIFAAKVMLPGSGAFCGRCAMYSRRASCHPDQRFPNEPGCGILKSSNRFVWVVATPAPPDPNPL